MTQSFAPAAAATGQDPEARAPRGDPRIPFAIILTVYAALGLTVLRFNRNVWQMMATVGSACLLDAGFAWVLRRQALFPLSAYISGVSLALLVNYAHDTWLLFIPVYLTIASKYLLTYQGKHVFNPSMFGLAVSLLASRDLISTAPAYQWGGHLAMTLFLITAALSLFVFRIGRTPLIASFLALYVLQILLRAWYLRWFIPPETLVLGTLSSAPFFLFVFYMITDPKTSPASTRGQLALSCALVFVDLVLHRLESVYTFFYAALIVAGLRFVGLHLGRGLREGSSAAFAALVHRDTLRAWAVVGGAGLAMMGVYRGVIRPAVSAAPPAFRLETVDRARSGVGAPATTEIFPLVDPRVRHIAKWLLSAGDAAASADFDGDGLNDLCLTAPFKPAANRFELLRNKGDFVFERVPVPEVERRAADPRRHGVPACPIFADHDDDGDQDLFVGFGYGKPMLLKNMLRETGVARFEDVSRAAGIDEHAVAIAANFLDFDRDGKLDLFVANAVAPWLGAYEPPRPLSIFDLVPPEHPGDRRMLGFMHRSWDNADNGGQNVLYRNLGGGRFERLDSWAMGLPETHWSLSVATGDLNDDGWPDLYVANDFGPDDLYLNEQGRRFRRIQGRMFGSVGKDSYKGMNASMGDVNRDGRLDVYVSNVHVALQAEGSLLWMNRPSADPFVPELVDEASRRGALNEHRFGWGGALGDLDLDGWLDIVQCNGMVDDRLDRRFAKCRTYWYVNEKIMRSGPEIHTYADMWGDLTGFCINGDDTNRVYLSRGAHEINQFVDVAPEVGVTTTTPSRGALLSDLDNDGDLDMLVTHTTAAPTLYRNTLGDAGPKRHWVGFALEGHGPGASRDAAGARVRISCAACGEGSAQMREVTITNAFAAQGDRRLLFGLGACAHPQEAWVSWPKEPPQRVGVLAVDRYHALRQPDRRAAR